MPILEFSVDWRSIVARNFDRVRSELEARGVDLLVVNSTDNVRYLTGYSPVFGVGLANKNYVVIGRSFDHPILFGFDFYVRSIRQHFPWLTDVRPVPDDMARAIGDLISDCDGECETVGVDGVLPYTLGRRLEQLNPAVAITNADSMLSVIRQLKSPAEIAIMERATAICEKGMHAAMEACVEGSMEYEVAARAEFAMRSSGAEGFPFSTVVASGENGALMHEMSTDKILRHGELVMVDIGCMFEGYYSDFARTFFVGRGRGTVEQRRAYRAVKAALDSMLQAIRPGAVASAIDAAGRAELRRSGFGDWEPDYFIGHGIGMAHWEEPIVTEACGTEIRPSMVLCVEPALHIPGVGGIRIEEQVVVTDAGSRVLTRTQLLPQFLDEAGDRRD